LSKNILIVRLSAIGDVIQSTPVARQIKLQHPDSRLTWIVERKGLPGIEHNPHIDRIMVMDTHRLSSWAEVISRMRGRFDITLDLQCLLKSGLVTLAVGSKERIGRADAREGSKLVYTKRMPTHMNQVYISQQYLEQCSDLRLDPNDYIPELLLPEADIESADKLWKELELPTDRPVVALIAFGAEPTREWSQERFAEVGSRLSEAGAQCVIFGTRDELPRAEALAAQMTHKPVILAGRTSLGQAAAMLKRCSLAIGGDTGLIHYSFALGTPLVCLLGPSPLRNGPKSDKAITVYAECPLRFCRPSEKCKRGAPGRPCMEEIGIEQVMAAAERLLGA
jgi:lipopolysaccharide heptosyltransferase II